MQEKLRDILQNNTPAEDWNTFQVADSIQLRKRIVALLNEQTASNIFVSQLLKSKSMSEMSILLRDDIDQGIFAVIGADNDTFRTLLLRYANLYPEFTKLVKRLLEKDSLIAVLRRYGTIPVLSNISTLWQRNVLTAEQFETMITSAYSEQAITALMGLAQIVKSIDPKDASKVRQVFQKVLDQGIVSIEDLSSTSEVKQQDISTFLQQQGNDYVGRYQESYINDIYTNLKEFIILIGDILFNMLTKQNDATKLTIVDEPIAG